jgi:hypothetical protein
VKVFADANASSVRTRVREEDGVIRAEIPALGIVDIYLPADALDALLRVDAVRWVEPAPPLPVPANNGVRADARVAPVHAAGYSGAGVLVGMWDGGVPETTHVDFGGRIITGESGAAVMQHSTHVAGTLVGDGSNSQAEGGGGLQWMGMAPEASLVAFTYDSVLVELDPAIALLEIDVSNNSWVYPVSPGNCGDYGDYSGEAPEFDAVVRGAFGRAIPMVFAAGNERDDGDCGLDTTGGYWSLPPPATAKNVITVGAHQSDAGTIAPFSSWGPVDDGRVKPDVTASGCQQSGDFGIKSTSMAGWGYSVLCGTSMAAPAVTGAIALLLEDWKARLPGAPLPSTFKALLAGFAQDRYLPGPDYRFGYGAIDIDLSMRELRTATTVEDSVDHGIADLWSFHIPSGLDTLALTLAWDDPPGAELAETTLVNDLDLELLGPSGTTYLPFVPDPAAPLSPAGTGQNRLDNMEQVRVLAPQPGAWSARVVGTSVPQGPQVYSLVGFDSASPADPALLTAFASSDTTVGLTWIRPGDTDRAGTLVVRAASAVAWTPVAGTSYTEGEEVVPGVVVVSAGDADHSSLPLSDGPLLPGTLYHYAAFSRDEIPNYSPGVSDTATTTSIAVSAPVPPTAPPAASFLVAGANPFRDGALFRMELPAPAVVSVRVYDAAGRLATVLLAGERTEGSHRVAWDGTLSGGRAAPAGVYFVRFVGGGVTRTEKIIRMR